MYRKAEKTDCGQIYQLICKLEGQTLPPEVFRAIFEKQLESEAFFCLVCELEGRVAGVLNLRFEEQLHHCGLVAEIMEFVVAPGFRGRGIGGELFRFAGETAKERGCIQIEAACNQKRTEAHRFYMGVGMEKGHFKFSKVL